MAPSEQVAARVMVIVYGVFLGLVLAERAAHLDDALAELRATFERRRQKWQSEMDYRKSWLRMAFDVWEATGERVDRA